MTDSVRLTSWTARLGDRLPEPLRRRAARLPGSHAPPLAAGTPTPRVAIIGSGFGGLGMGVRLRQAGIETFTIHEKADRLGGTWRDNRYPGAACDVPSHLYSLSFAPKADWSRRFPEQPEILDYLESVADDFGLRPHLAFGSEVVEAAFDEEQGCWHLAFADGSTDDVDVVVSATGQLNRPHVPDIPGLDDFAGTAFHSARWDHDHDLSGRDVAVIGIGASAIQFVPELAGTTGSLRLFQRSANYVGPKPDGEFSERAKWAFARFPTLQRLYRASIWARFEARWSLFTDGSRTAPLAQKAFDKGLGELVSVDLPGEVVVPDYPLGCKRILISNDWYPTLLRPDVAVITEPIERIVPEGVVAGGTTHPVDTIVFGTGFQTTGFLAPMRVTGRAGRDLHDGWAAGAEAHLGITVSGFPNLFLLYGPNTNLGHNSIVFMLERQIGYALTCIRDLVEDGLPWRDVRPEAQAASNRRLVAELDRTVWAAGCHSWYKTASGRITNNWSGPSARYWLRTVRRRSEDFDGPGPHPSAGPRRGPFTMVDQTP
ncbi:NAD(P)/FAD-dependent oxidoreductase [Aquihabitans sp. G128]|uniref:flavin-containing monooxygenase n=1 Tax=Aquihabitans sp. G128 TaxID=2849779 RepID=UPI001C23A8D8|nr:NAD(P)/FAD-dependent oxidoreductase [Aquihabitans sp. G128]QXC60386.1 NAD(P)/FAD-dependent oxidoreductase [Aquihabitans sp. G128]